MLASQSQESKKSFYLEMKMLVPLPFEICIQMRRNRQYVVLKVIQTFLVLFGVLGFEEARICDWWWAGMRRSVRNWSML